MRKLPPLKALQIFESAARQNSFQAAADELFITPSAVSHQIKQLEDYLGIALFHRSHRRVDLTDVGAQYAQHISQAFGIIQTATRDIELRGKSDILVIQSTPTFATQWLMPRLARFSNLYPDIDVRLNATMLVPDTQRGGIDIAIRYGEILSEAGVEMETLPEEQIAVMCSPNLLSGSLKFDIRQHTLIHSEVNLYRWQDWCRDYGIELKTAHGPRFDRAFMSISAATDGIGVALESTLMAERELLDGRLVMPLGLSGEKKKMHRLLYAKNKTNLPKITAFRAWLYEELNLSLAALREQSMA